MKPWGEIPKIGEKVSGLGHYTACAVLPEEWSDEMGAVLTIGSLNKNTGAVYVNDKKAGALDFDRLAIDVSNLLRRGENKIMVEVSSGLNNRLRARGYYEKGNETSQELAASANNALEVTEEADAGGENVEETGADAMFHITIGRWF